MTFDPRTLPLAATVSLPDDPEATTALGEHIGARLHPGEFLALVGAMGAGKTTFTRGVGRGLEVDDPDAVASPTYLLVVEHPGPRPLRHADAYLPAKLAGFLADGGLEALLDPTAVVVVEWADRIGAMVPEGALWLSMDMAAQGGRRIEFRTRAPEAFPWLASVGQN